jgi:hypothetical protein
MFLQPGMLRLTPANRASVLLEFADQAAEGVAGGDAWLWRLDGGEALHGHPAASAETPF